MGGIITHLIPLSPDGNVPIIYFTAPDPLSVGQLRHPGESFYWPLFPWQVIFFPFITRPLYFINCPIFNDFIVGLLCEFIGLMMMVLIAVYVGAIRSLWPSGFDTCGVKVWKYRMGYASNYFQSHVVETGIQKWTPFSSRLLERYISFM